MLTNLARTVADEGHTAQALSYVDQAIAIFQKSGSSDEPDHVARVLELRGTLQMRAGNLSQARASLTQALAERERISAAHIRSLRRPARVSRPWNWRAVNARQRWLPP